MTQAPVVQAPAPEPIVTPPAAPLPVVVQPIPLLPAPENRLPPTGYRFGIQELRNQRRIDFTWAAVPGANAYIFTLYHQSDNGRRQIIHTVCEDRTGWTLENTSLLDRGTLIWQVEAVNSGRDGTIEQRGNIGENSFIVDIPLPSQPSVRVDEQGSPNGY